MSSEHNDVKRVQQRAALAFLMLTPAWGQLNFKILPCRNTFALFTPIDMWEDESIKGSRSWTWRAFDPQAIAILPSIFNLVN
ncbi:hypothetical protein ACTHPF_17845 [Paenibacillus sp. SAF-054]|uniref:hypothetical protein n=1 Tax=unclassified Paenibacillus TaxID=185978 RepID=UPI003F7E80A5